MPGLPERGRRERAIRLASLLILALALAFFGLSCGEPEPAQAPLGPISQAATPGSTEGVLSPGRSESREVETRLVVSVLDPQMDSLLRAGERWRSARGPDRAVIDQVYLVPDLSGFLEAVAAWDERSFFPILIDDPAWTLPFVRAFRPARVVRIAPKEPRKGTPDPAGPAPPNPSELERAGALWLAAERAVARAWTRDDSAETDLPYAGAVPDRLGPTPSGLVFSNSTSPMLAGAVALAAGRFQPLVRLDPVPSGTVPDAGSPRVPVNKGFRDVLLLSQARGLARLIEKRAAAIVGTHDALGDRCDFLTLAVDWPYRYRNDAEEGVIRGDQALDDLIGRVLETDEGGLASSRNRWAFTGRLLGDPAASVFRAMCALFLTSGDSLLWNTYSGEGVWSAYRMDEAAAVLGQLQPSMAPPPHRAGTVANLDAWHQTTAPVNRFGWIMLNSSGGPRRFSITGGGGVPADLPRGRPTVVSMIHSFSAADPLDRSTIAGRWLENGAYIYFGAMNEPFLHAFRTPRLVAELASAEIPLAAALRQGADEPFGRPWRLVYLGDPLFHFRAVAGPLDTRRVPPDLWYAGTSKQPAAAEVLTSGSRFERGGDDPTRLQECLTAALAAACHPETNGLENARDDAARSESAPWVEVLAGIDRRTLAPARRSVLDELMIDALLERGETRRLLDWLRKLPPDECDPRVRDAVETAAMSHLAALARAGDVASVLDLWEELIRRPWPAGSLFPKQLTDRLGAVMAADPWRYQEPYRKKLVALAAARASLPSQSESPGEAVITGELKRLKIEVEPPARSP